MFVTLKRLIEWFLLVFVFLLFTILMYWVVLIVNTWIEPDQFKEPIGHSIKVDGVIDSSFQSHLQLQNESMIERLKLFYWYGGY
ncbi:DUF4227 family protein [Tepidibacillus fermentans]|uniref:Uncharacterized protein DUF4227 n=1 Tax=Tepidibacillus fermentans TaxID=1281767 RepID=A0A4R3KKC6_9BACI|nr:DUF4227 family protein [Tepidibacillus fermentans]TCS84077.1 uncharacterized protein DUF4227 [Tepidibacillus fermentans]